jgi:hypothetical protein
MRIGRIVIDVAPLRESRDFRWLYTGRFIASAGNVIATTAANWQVYALTHSPLAVVATTVPACAMNRPVYSQRKSRLSRSGATSMTICPMRMPLRFCCLSAQATTSCPGPPRPRALNV